MDWSVLEEKPFFQMPGVSCSSELDWVSSIVSIAGIASKKIGALICSVKLLSREVAIYLYKSTIQPCMQYSCHSWIGATSCCLDMLNKLEKHM